MNDDQNIVKAKLDAVKTEKEKKREEFLKTVESKIKKSEKDIWYIHDIEHVFDKRK
jgi:hypothetical protein